MRKMFLSIFIVLFMFLLVACSTKKDESNANKSGSTAIVSEDEWVEMDVFHMIMAETFHPFKDSANLEPIKTRASELASSAEKWSNAPLPQKVNTAEVKEKIHQLKKSTAALAETVKSADDKTIGEALTEVHDLFHEIQEAWYSKGEGHEHH